MSTIRSRVFSRTPFGVFLVGALAVAVLLGGATVRPSPPRLVTQSHSPVWPAQCDADGSRCEQQLVMPGGATVTAWSNYPLTGASQVMHAMLVVHDDGRDAQATFTGMMQAASRAGVAADTLVLAPLFKTDEDSPGPDDAVWSSGAWEIGTGADRPRGLSSFAVADGILDTLADRSKFPNVRWITVVGQSAGGQFTDRYATFGRAPSLLRGVFINFVVANPSSFVYFDAYRPAVYGGFAVPRGGCSNYDTYPDGMRGRGGYVSELTPARAFDIYTSRRVTILNSGAETSDNDGDVDTDCGAMLQGSNRVDRGANFFSLIHRIRPTAPHDRVVVSGVDDDENFALFESPHAASVLFGPGARTTNTSQ
jgi:hypothetical protein